MSEIYEWLCRQGDLRGAVAGLEDEQLRGLSRHLAWLGVVDGVPGEVWATVVAEAAARFLRGDQS